MQMQILLLLDYVQLDIVEILKLSFDYFQSAMTAIIQIWLDYYHSQINAIVDEITDIRSQSYTYFFLLIFIKIYRAITFNKK